MQPNSPGTSESARVANDPLVSSPPVIMAPRADGIDVVWAVTAPSRGWVEFTPDVDQVLGPEVGWPEPTTVSCDRYGFVPQGDEFLQVRVEGWSPGTTYRIRTVTVATIGDRREVSAWKRVRTLDPAAPGSTFVVWNDTHLQHETLSRLDDSTPRADVFIWNGDVCRNWSDASAMAPTVLNPAGRDVTEGRPMIFAWGNHDVRGPEAHRLPLVVATANHKPYHAFRSGPVAAIVLHTGEDKPDDHPSFGGRVAFTELRRRQADWLREEIQRPEIADAPYRIVFCHLPLRWVAEPVLTNHDYRNGTFDHYSRSSRVEWHESLVRWGAQLIISGHTHQSAFLPSSADFPYAQLTGGGPDSRTATWIQGCADAQRLTVTTHRLDGSEAHTVEFGPISEQATESPIGSVGAGGPG